MLPPLPPFGRFYRYIVTRIFGHYHGFRLTLPRFTGFAQQLNHDLSILPRLSHTAAFSTIIATVVDNTNAVCMFSLPLSLPPWT